MNDSIDRNVVEAFSSDLIEGERVLWAQSASAAPWYKTAASFFLNVALATGAGLFALALLPGVWSWLSAIVWPTITIVLTVVGFGFSLGLLVMFLWAAWRAVQHDQSIYMITNRRILGRQTQEQNFFSVSGRPIDYVGLKAGPGECSSLLLRMGEKPDTEEETWIELLWVPNASEAQKIINEQFAVLPGANK